jgi:hypothetical protein
VSPLDVHVSAGSAPGGADLANFLPGAYGLAYLDRDRAEMAMRCTFCGVILDDDMLSVLGSPASGASEDHLAIDSGQRRLTKIIGCIPVFARDIRQPNRPASCTASSLNRQG